MFNTKKGTYIETANVLCDITLKLALLLTGMTK